MILDRYLTRQFLATLVFALVAFIALVLIVDLVEHLDEFIDKKVPKLVILTYYLYSLPYMIVLTLPVAMLLASLFSVGQLARYNELIAMKSCGISLYRILVPLFGLAFLVSVLAFFFGEKVVPWASQNKENIKRVYIDRLPPTFEASTTDIYLQDRADRRLVIGFFDVRDTVAHQVSIQEVRGDRMIRRWDAPRMIWQKGAWILENGYAREFQGEEEVAQPFETYRFGNLAFQPKDIARVQKDPIEMNYEELKRFIAQVRRSGGDPERWKVDLHLKIAFPFANLIIVLFGAPLASSKRRSGVAVGFAISLFICFLFFGLIKFAQTLGHNGTLPPFVAAWIANGLFGLGAVGTMMRVRK